MKTLILNKEFSILNFRFWIHILSNPGNSNVKAALGFAMFLLSGCSSELIPVGDAGNSTNQSAFVSKVFDYQYAPGQHASLISPNEKGSNFVGEPWLKAKTFTSLGGWGGYLIAGFDHAVNNTNGPDIALYTQPSVASEPGVVLVMTDSNNDGMPNDGPWFEIKGSEYNHTETIRSYEVTYYKPAASGYVTWKDNQGKAGTLVPEFVSDSWWWQGYGDKSSVTFKGVRLPDAYLNNSKDPAIELWMPRKGLFRFGYAECYENEDYNQLLKANLLDISSAVDASGNPANLTKINFIKIQSGVFQIAGWLNEISTEISGAADLHLLDKKSYQ